MIFSSVLFLFRFLPVFVICYFVAPRRMRNLILFLGSLIFYAWGEPVYVVLMLFSTVSDFFHGKKIESCREKGRSAKGWLVSSLVINLFVLGFFKYADFLTGALGGILGRELPLLNLPLPIGISFYTFQTMSYSIDVYRGETKAQKDLLAFGVFVAMFPQLIAGPIVKYRTAEPDLVNRHASLEDIAYGIKRFVWGLGKKVLLANNIGMLWTEISQKSYGEMTVVMSWTGIIAYAMQIYFDFSGYSDMAIGLGRILGFHFPENFNYPYISRSITEFWRRWHISLGSWFKEYVYIPLGGNRRGLFRQLINILIVWSLTGIWHGAGWNFLLWGLWFALFLILEKLFLGRLLEKLPGAAGWLYSMLVVLAGWVFFSLESMEAVKSYLLAMTGWGNIPWINRETLYILVNNWLLLVILCIGATPFLHKWKEKIHSRIYDAAEVGIMAAVLLLSIAYIVEASYNPFLYFRF